MGSLQCPLCGKFTAFSPLWLKGKGTLGETLGEKLPSNIILPATVQLAAVPDGQYMTLQDPVYAILTCQACGKWFVAQRPRYHEDWSAAYPIAHKSAPEEIAEPIKGEFEEAYLCFAVGAYRACVAMCQITLEAVWCDQKVSGIQDLKDKEIISGKLCNQANEVRLWGNIIKHQPISDGIESEDAEQLLGYLEALLDDVYIEPKRLTSLAQKREQLKKK